MKRFYLFSMFCVILLGCSSKNPPLRDISNAKMALVRADTSDSNIYEPQMLKNIKIKYKALQNLMIKEEYKSAKYLAQEIHADARVLEKRSSLRAIQGKIKSKEGEINLIKKEFTHVNEEQ